MNKKIALGCLLVFEFLFANAQKSDIAVPSAVQYQWQERERIMFVHFGVATWTGNEYDETGKFDISRLNPSKLNTDQWCEVAKSWGAKEIIFVAKHVGGFCWWPTKTTEYCVRNIPWKNGKGDLMKEVAASCKKYGIKMGVYIYPGDVAYGAGIGSGGKTKDPSLQEAYNKVFRQQLTEVLTNYGEMAEVWFDGNCVVEVGDILKKYASKATIFQSPYASLRWPGTESGKLSYPVWNTVPSGRLKLGLATQYDDTPDGDAWAPLEADAPLYDHYWFWSKEKEKKRKSLEELIDMYYKSVGYGGNLLINSCPDTTGLIVPDDVSLYRAFGAELQKRFEKPVAQLKLPIAINPILHFQKPTAINHIVLEEQYQYGHRIRAYTIEAKVNGKWVEIAKGESVGRKKIEAFKTITTTDIRINVTKNKLAPNWRSVSAYHVSNFEPSVTIQNDPEWKVCGSYDTKTFKNGADTLVLNLDSFITKPGQYEIAMVADVAITGTYIVETYLEFDGENTQQEYLQKTGHSSFNINRTAQIDRNSHTKLTLYMKSDNEVFQNRGVFKIRARR
ncbi:MULTISPECIES: alpha-L-fucosidase [unclassified Paraflavitalea]|uniref:alpha-L-fucosidase n=1 Tax=unclassified Paraflavitalea TaxID=2798305 RepID=UPI003D33A442